MPDLVADAVGVRASGRSARRRAAGRATTWPVETSTMSQPAALQPARERDRVVAVEAAVDPVHRADAHGHRLLVRPHGAARREHLERELRAVLARTRPRARSVSGDRNDEQQVAVGHVELEQVESRRGRPLASPRRTARARRPCPRASSRAASGGRASARDRRRRDQRPVALVERLVVALPHQLRRALAAGVSELRADRRCASARARSRRSASTPPCARRGTGRRSPA